MLLPKRLWKGPLVCCLALFCAASPVSAEPSASPSSGPSAQKLEFSELWAYLLDGEERFLDASHPITDIGYFGAGISSFGKLAGLPRREKIAAFDGRVHLVVAEIGNYALTHFCLDPAFPLRDALIADIIEGARPFDGVQIDFEAVNSKDCDNFYSFIVLLKEGLPGKTLSVALPACIEEKNDRFGYERMSRIADRVVVMAYDEHWSTSEPGPVASIEWCRKVSAYALSKVPARKLVMGAPFYGRAWGDKPTSRAYKYSSLADIIEEKGISSIQRQGEIPFVEYIEIVNVKAFFDDAASTLVRLALYRAASVRNIAFWRLGQEDAGTWEGIAAAPMLVAPRRSAAQSGRPTP